MNPQATGQTQGGDERSTLAPNPHFIDQIFPGTSAKDTVFDRKNMTDLYDGAVASYRKWINPILTELRAVVKSEEEDKETPPESLNKNPVTGRSLPAVKMFQMDPADIDESKRYGWIDTVFKPSVEDFGKEMDPVIEKHRADLVGVRDFIKNLAVQNAESLVKTETDRIMHALRLQEYRAALSSMSEKKRFETVMGQIDGIAGTDNPFPLAAIVTAPIPLFEEDSLRSMVRAYAAKINPESLLREKDSTAFFEKKMGLVLGFRENAMVLLLRAAKLPEGVAMLSPTNRMIEIRRIQANARKGAFAA